MPTPVSVRTALALALLFVLPAGLAAQRQDVPPPVPLPGMYDGGYLVFQSADSAFKYWFDARAMIDGAIYDGSKNQLANGVEIRRARLGLKSTYYRNWLGEIDVDFAGDAVEVKDLWIGHTTDNGLLRIGNFKEPFSLETLTSSKFITFMERSYVDAFSPDRHIGMSYSRWGNRWQASAGAFGQGSGDVDATGRDQGYGLTARFTAAPFLARDRVLHVGAAISRRTPDAAAIGSEDRMRIRARPETDVNQARFFSTGRVRDVKYEMLYNVELATVRGPLSGQAEFTLAEMHRYQKGVGGPRPTANFWSGYAFVSYFLTGERRPYLVHEGEFDRIFPRSSRGAWEIAARYSTIDLNDNSAGVGILGGRGNNYTLGINWYVNPNLRFMANYVRVVTDANSIPDQGTAPLKPQDKFNIMQVRASLAL